ncbi:unnamed protein product [Ambrosiozyma monospora]|uniref:Unnamed protein product n=1 Tax=Ambrosiozyma monospora TaxID=43982 RepID=A0ACB5T1F2_AMBMO|nr:unnamed protein product [Ambrosiozyma monospora]
MPEIKLIELDFALKKCISMDVPEVNNNIAVGPRYKYLTRCPMPSHAACQTGSSSRVDDDDLTYVDSPITSNSMERNTCART